MRTLYLVIPCLLMFIGWVIYQPVSNITDWQLEVGHNRLQLKQSKLKRTLRYGMPYNRSITP